MTITIKVEAAVPYTQVVCACERHMDYESYWDNKPMLINVVSDLTARVNAAVDSELEGRGIKLGPDGLRI